MKILFSAVFKPGTEAPGKDGPVMLSQAAELSSLGFFQRSTAKEVFVMFSRQFAKASTEPGQRSSVRKDGYMSHVYHSPMGVVAVCFADDECAPAPPPPPHPTAPSHTAGDGVGGPPQSLQSVPGSHTGPR